MQNTENSLTPADFQTRLLQWFDLHGRKQLPWQQDKSPYRVWISEIMLQQTQVSTVIPFFERFVSRFPDINALAAAKEDEVLHLWTGLGYYHRARNLQQAAKNILADHQGIFPDTLDALLHLPGIGRSTAGAILSIAFQKAFPIMDGNVRRVLTRLHGITEWPGEKEINETLWKLAETYTPTKRVAEYTQAMMDLGATLCRRSKPSCHTCPFKTDCIAHHKGLENQIPRAKPKKAIPVRQATFLILQQANTVLLQKRAGEGVWRGLWSFPEITGKTTLAQIKKACRQLVNLAPQKIMLGDAFRHTFSHYHLDITPAFINITTAHKKSLEAPQQIWYNLQETDTIGLPAPVKLLLSTLS